LDSSIGKPAEGVTVTIEVISLDALDSSPQDFPKSLATGWVFQFFLIPSCHHPPFPSVARAGCADREQGPTYRQTDKDGRCTSLLDPSMKLSTGVYKLIFHTGEYFTKQGVKTLYPFVEVCHISL